MFSNPVLQAVGPDLREPAIASMLLTTLCTRLAAMGPYDRDLIGILECLNLVRGCLGTTI